MDFLLGLGLLIPLLIVNVVMIIMAKDASPTRSLTLMYAMWGLGMFIVFTYVSTVCVLVKPNVALFGTGLMNAMFIYVIAKIFITFKILKKK